MPVSEVDEVNVTTSRPETTNTAHARYLKSPNRGPSPSTSAPCLAPSRIVLFDFLGGAVRISRPATPYTTDNQVGDLDAVMTQLEARASRPRRERRLGPTGHRLGTGLPRARGRAGLVEHLLLRNADAPAARGDLVLLHAG